MGSTVGMVSVFDPGVGTELSWQVSANITLGTGITFQTRRFRLRDRTRTQGDPPRTNRTDDGGVGQESANSVFASLKWKPSRKTSIDLLAGVGFGGNVRGESKTAGRVHDDDYDPAPFVGLRAQYFF
jgi:hypothetical protein